MSQGHILRDQIKEPITSNRPKEITDMRSPVKFVAVVSFFFFFEGGEGKERVHTCHDQGKPISGRSIQVQGAHVLPLLL